MLRFHTTKANASISTSTRKRKNFDPCACAYACVILALLVKARLKRIMFGTQNSLDINARTDCYVVETKRHFPGWVILFIFFNKGSITAVRYSKALILKTRTRHRNIVTSVAISKKPTDLYLTIICPRLGEYWRIIPETKSRGLFDNIHRAWGE